MRNATDAGRYVIDMMCDNITYLHSDGVVKIPMTNLTAYEKGKWTKGYRELSELGYICRTKRSHYLLNPTMLIPSDYSKALDLWKSTVDPDLF